MITTFEDEPYRGAVQRQRDRALPRRRADLDAVPLRGASVGDPERPDRLRPLPRRLQHLGDDARGQGQADPLAQPPRGRRGLALRQGPLRVPAPARRRPDRRPARARPAPRLRRVSWDDALDEAEALLRGAEAGSSTALSGSETVEQAYALGKLLRQGLGAHAAVLPEAVSTRSTPSARRSRRSQTREVVVVVGDETVAERAPIVDLWMRKARRNGAESSRSCASRSSARSCERARRRELGSRRPDLVRAAAAAAARGSRSSPHGSASRRSPAAARSTCRRRRTARGVADAWAAARTKRRRPEPIGLPDRLRRRGRGRPGRARARRARRERDRDLDVPRPRRRLGRPRPAGHELPRARRHVRQPRGPRSATAPRGDPARARRARVDCEARRALRRRALAARGGRLRGGLASAATAGSRSARSASAHRCRAAPYDAPSPRRCAALPAAERAGRSTSSAAAAQRYRPLFSGPAVERVPELQFQRPERRDRARRRRRRARTRSRPATSVSVRSNGTSVELRARRQPSARRAASPGSPTSTPASSTATSRW